MCWRRAITMPARQPGSSSTDRKRDRLDVEPAAREEPRDRRVRVPHLARAQLVAAPDRRRHLRHELEQPTRAIGIVAQPARALDRLLDVRNDPVPPAPDLVAEEAEGVGPRVLRRHPRRRRRVRSRRPTPVPARSRIVPRARTPAGQSGRGRSDLDGRATRRPLRRPSRSAVRSDRRRRAAASRGRSRRPTATACPRHLGPSSARSKKLVTRCFVLVWTRLEAAHVPRLGDLPERLRRGGGVGSSRGSAPRRRRPGRRR